MERQKEFNLPTFVLVLCIQQFYCVEKPVVIIECISYGCILDLFAELMEKNL